MTDSKKPLIPESVGVGSVSSEKRRVALVEHCRLRSFRIMVGSLLLVAAVFAGAMLGFVCSLTQQKEYSYEKDPTYWHNVAQDEIEASLREQPRGVAKNVILFLGDGMGPSTVTAGRIFAGQLLGLNGEEYKLSFDYFPYTGLSRTYNVDSQITDSAASATAYLTGVKTNQGILGLSGAATRAKCSTVPGTEVHSILHWSHLAGKSTGVVTTTRVTHATPGASYSHSADRDWESDRTTPGTERACEDIALQLVTRNPHINVVMGGGRAYFYPEGFPDPDPDPKFNTSKVSRLDRRNLVEEWKNDKRRKHLSHEFVYNKDGLDKVKLDRTDYLLGLFKQDHMSYDIDRDRSKEPSLAEMTQKAIEILKRNEHGFFLLVEGGKIDHGHHDSLPHYALSELVSLAEAVDVAKKVTQEDETLIVVTADHSHVLSIAGYATRGTSILGLSTLDHKISLDEVIDGKPYTTLLYGNGPGYVAPRPNLTNTDTTDKNYAFQSAVPIEDETHGGEDVTIFANGPQSFLYTGVHEQNYIPMVMAYASCVGPYGRGGKPCARDQNQSPARAAPQKTAQYEIESTNKGLQAVSSFAVVAASIVFNVIFRVVSNH